jgi:transcriptional regulator with XRE-family HTH domain
MSGARSLTSIDRSVAERLKTARLESGVTQEHTARVLGVSFQQVQKYESGANRISAGRLLQLSHLYKKPLDWFFDDTPTLAKTPVRRRVRSQDRMATRAL